MPESVLALGAALGVLLLRCHGHETTEDPGVARAHTGQTTGVDDAPEPVFSHFGICVSDLERSLRFYCDALGFEKAESHAIGSEFARLMDLPDVAVTSQFIRRGPTAIELLAFREPAPVRSTRAAGRQPARA